MTTMEAAGILDCTDENVARLCKRRKLVARKVPRRKGSKAWRYDVDGKSVRARRKAMAA